VGCNAYAGPELVAHYVTQPLVAVFRGVEERGLLSLNTATHPDHRGRALHPELARRTYAAEAGFGFVTGAANQYRTRSFVEKLDFRFVRSLDARFGLAPLPRPRRKSEVDFARVWDAPTLAWRLLPPHRP
jgi:hypothetical protein